MRTNILLICSILALFSVTTASVDYNVTQYFLNFDTIPLGYANGYYYVYPSIAYDPVNHQAFSPIIFGSNLPTVVLPFSLNPWAVAKLNGNYVLVQLSSNVLSIVSKYPLPSTFEYEPILETSGNYLLFINKLNKAFDVLVFDTINQEFVCNNSFTNLTGTWGTGWFNGEGLLFSNNTNAIYYATCSSDPIKKFPFYDVPYVPQQIYGFHNSTVFVVWLAYFQLQTVQTFTLYQDGDIKLGPKYTLSWPYQINDTYLFANNETASGFDVFLYYTIDSNLNLVQQAQFNTSINTSSPTISTPIIGTNQVYVSLGNGHYVFDSSTSNIVSTFSPQPPINFANGSNVSITWSGYSIQSPGQPIYFKYWQNQDSFQVPGSPNLWVLFDLTESPVYCAALFMDSNTNTITQYATACPGNQTYGAATVYDAGYDSDGKMYVAILDQQNILFVVTEEKFWGPLTVAQLYYQPLISINVTNGTGIIVTSLLNAISFYLENGTIYQKVLLQNLGSQRWVSRISGPYFLFAYNNYSPPLKFTTYDAVNNVCNNNFSSNTISYTTSIMPVGVSGSTFTNVLLPQLNWVTMIDTNGNSTSISTTFTEVQPSVFISSSNQFYIWDNFLSLSYGALVEIASQSSEIEL